MGGFEKSESAMDYKKLLERGVDGVEQHHAHCEPKANSKVEGHVKGTKQPEEHEPTFAQQI